MKQFIWPNLETIPTSKRFYEKKRDMMKKMRSDTVYLRADRKSQRLCGNIVKNRAVTVRTVAPGRFLWNQKGLNMNMKSAGVKKRLIGVWAASCEFPVSDRCAFSNSAGHTESSLALQITEAYSTQNSSIKFRWTDQLLTSDTPNHAF